MAATTFQSGKQLVKDAAGVLYFTPATDEALAVTASKNGGSYAAVNAGTVAAKVGGTNAEGLYKLTVNLADTATVGPIAFKCIGTTDTIVVLAEVIPLAHGTVGTLVDDTITAAAIQADALGSLELAAGAASEIAAAVAGGGVSIETSARYKIQIGELTAAKRTIIWDQAGATMPANCLLSLDGATPENSDAAPATVSGTLRSLVLSAAEVAVAGTLHIANTTTSTNGCYQGLLVDLVGYDPAVGGPLSAMGLALRSIR